MKQYIVKLEELITYEVEIEAHSSKEAELEAYRHPERWHEQAGLIKLLDIKQGVKHEYQNN